jgi:hypothetical protein
VAPASRRRFFFHLPFVKDRRRDAGATTQHAFLKARERILLPRIQSTEYFSGTHSFFISQFWNYFLTSGAHARKKNPSESAMAWLAAPRGEWFTERLRGWAHQGNAAHRVRSEENVSEKGGHNSGRLFLFGPHVAEEFKCGRKHGDRAAGKKHLVILSEAKNLSFFDLHPEKRRRDSSLRSE